MKVNEEVYYGIIPMLKGERIYSFWDIFLVTAGYAIATWCYVQGGYIASMLGFKQLMTNTFFGMTLAGLILCLAVIIPTRYGVDLWIYQRAIFGYKGIIIIFLLAMMSTWGYEAINAQLYANSITKIIGAAGTEVPAVWEPWIALTCIIFGWWISIKGPVAVKTATRIMVPSLMAVGVIIMILVFSNYSLAELAVIKPLYADSYSGNWEPYMLVMEWNIAFIFAWYPALGVLPRLVKTERSSYWGHVAGYATAMAWFICIGALTGLAMADKFGAESVDPTEWLIALGGTKLGLLSLVFIGVANITTHAAATYSLTVSTKVLKPDWDYKVVATLWSVWCAILVFWGAVWNYYQTFLAIAGVICGPAIALLLVDYYLVRKQKFSMAGLFQSGKSMVYNYSGGFNIPVLVSFIAGIFVYFLVYDPINYVPKSGIFLYTTATGLAMIVSGALYWALSTVEPIKRYLRKDLEEMKVAASGHQSTGMPAVSE